MFIFNLALLILVSFCAKVQADTCDVGVDGCSWTCKSASLPPGTATCLALPATPQSCEIGSSVTMCGTTCTCSKDKTCTVGQDGCSWDCIKAPQKPGQVTCLAIPGTPETCVPGSSVSSCGTTCTCSKAETCTVGKDGCSWDCITPPLKPGQARCLALPGTPETCVPGSSVSICGTTCTCSKAKTCKVGVKGCSWTCKRAPLKPGQVTCLAIPGTPETCIPGSSVSSCGTTCTCSQEKPCTVGKNGCKWSCVNSSPPGSIQCLAYPATPSECYPGETSSLCGITCTCGIERCTRGKTHQ